MKLLFVILLFVVINGSMGQILLGANGLKLPPINLLTVFRILRKGWNMLMNSMQSEEVKKKDSPRSGTNLIPDSNDITDKIVEASTTNDKFDEIVAKLNLTCHDESCKGMTAEELLKNSQLNVSGEKILQLFKDHTDREAAVNTNEIVSPETKSPSLLPEPFRSSGWIATYLALNGVLLSLYLVLGIPYFSTGRTVDEAKSKFDDNGHDFSGEYMGYTSYGDNDMMMNYIMDFEDEDLREDRSSEENYDDSPDDYGTMTQYDNNRCLEQMLCLKPVYGRALTATHLGVKILEWIPGLKSMADLFNRRLRHLDDAVESGRHLSCHQYKCKRRK